MRRIIPLILPLLFLYSIACARHITGGEIFYKYIGDVPGGHKYEITLKLYRDCNSTGAQLDGIANIAIYSNQSPLSPFVTIPVQKQPTVRLNLTKPGPCIDNPPIVCYEVGYYITQVDLPETILGYTVAYQRCCRIENISNVINSDQTGATYSATIPGTDDVPSAPKNNSAVFVGNDTVVVCERSPFSYDFSAIDPDKAVFGDSLSYGFVQAYVGGSTGNASPNPPGPPPYQAVPYGFGFTYQRPMGADVTVNPKTGLVSGVAPAAGIYVVTVAAYEYRNHIVIAVHRKDLQIKVAACSIASADLQPDFITCDGFSLQFFNRTSSPLIRSYYWDFGVAGMTTDTSNQKTPTFVFPDTGVYRVMLITNRGQDCSDTGYTNAHVFPGFFPGFLALTSCKGIPVRFTDTTRTKYGVVSEWHWAFGDPNSSADSSQLQNPSYIYNEATSYQVSLIVSNSKGCTDTVTNPVSILSKPTLFVSNDTLICSIDTLQLGALGTGTFSWTPAYNINDQNVPNPLVSPDIPTKYFVRLTSAPGCENIDSVFVDVRTFITVDAGADTTICLTDTLTLRPVTEALGFSWTPAATLNDPKAKNPIARPQGVTTTYSILANLGKCTASDFVTVRAVPYPTALAAGDTTVCYGDTARLFASGGIKYEWLPAAGLTNADISDPFASPPFTTSYVVAVFDNKGCPKPSFDSALVTVIPPVPARATNDTAVVVDQPLQLHASGATHFLWSPSRGLESTDDPNPVAHLSEDISYIVKVTTDEGCFAYDTVNVRVFKTAPDIFVPTAFTPNGDGTNDVFKAIPVGITSLDYFRVFNRWGQLVYNSPQIGSGWDGKVNGKLQATDSYVWMVQGTDFTGKVISKKGTVTLIR